MNITNILAKKADYEKALELCIEVRDQIQVIAQNLYVEIIVCQGIIGNIYFDQGMFDKAEAFYSTAFLVTKRHLLMGDLLQINVIESLIELYEKQGDKQRAINLCSEQLSSYSQHLASNHASIAHLLVMNGKLSHRDHKERSHCYQRALHILEKNIHSQYTSAASCLMAIGQDSEVEKMYEEAASYYKRVNEI